MRKYLLAFVLALAAVSQSGSLAPVTFKGYPLCGLPLHPERVHRTGELLDGLRAQFPAGGLTGVYGADDGLNSESLNFASAKQGYAMKFADEPLCPACAAALLCKTRPGAPSAGSLAFLRLRREPWFASLFEKRSAMTLPDGAQVELFTKVRGLPKPFEEGTYELKALSLGDLVMESAVLKVEGYDALSGRYAKASFFCPSATLFDGDVYGFELALQGVELSGSGKPVISGIAGGRLVSAKVSSYAVEKFLAARFPALGEAQVSLDGSLSVTGELRGEKLEAEFYPAMPSPGVLELKPVAFRLGPVKVPELITTLFSLRFDLSDNPYGIKVSGFQLRGQMLEFR